MNKLIPFDRLESKHPLKRDRDDGWEWRVLANREERAYVKTLSPDKMLEYLAKRNEEEFVERI